MRFLNQDSDLCHLLSLYKAVVALSLVLMWHLQVILFRQSPFLLPHTATGPLTLPGGRTFRLTPQTFSSFRRRSPLAAAIAFQIYALLTNRHGQNLRLS